ncbi:putative protein [Mycolicibacterium vanbaalenii]|uniref:ATP/GTP-binding protein n=1 Tax=Mycolicibacterium vanbaalenii TaxID=110539 RepID=A0A5S9QKE3_MYCVN|nr:hypothetical protein [Mycolicibacterium vanbaalenii]CAA0118733.1 putative protein [Mycolicibacterium vanbaalenii]
MARRRAVGRKAPSRNPLPAPRRIEVGADGNDYEVRPVPAARATKIYRCPGCDHEIKPGTAHVVALPADSGTAQDAAEDRRHWHTACWTHRATRSPTRRWS